MQEAQLAVGACARICSEMRHRKFNGAPIRACGALTVTWGVRSVCRPTGCVATAARLSGDPVSLSPIVFDDVGGRWVSVGIVSDTCNNAPTEFWAVWTLQPRPDGTLAGDRTSVMSGDCAAIARTVTLTRTGDVDVNSVPDPASQPPRVVSPAEALYGRYHLTWTYPNGAPPAEQDYAVRTDCLRTGDRCMSYFHSPEMIVMPLVFGGRDWIYDREFDGPCSAGGTGHVKITVTYPLPAPPQDPITLLTGHGHQENTGNAGCPSTDVDIKVVRTAD
jgi:serine/threonine-protein kinase